MTDHLALARNAYAVAVATGWPEDAHTEVVGHILDHLEAQQADPDPDPLDETNHADRYDLGGDRWWWCDKCCGFRMAVHTVHGPGYGWTAVEIDEDCGPLTFAPQPATTPTTAPQPEQAHGDADEPARPAERHTAPDTHDVRERYFIGVMLTTAFTHSGREARNDFDLWLDDIRAEVWDEGHRTGRQDERNACHCEAWNDDECGCGNYGNSTTPNPYRKARA